MATTPQLSDLLTVPSQDDVLNQEVLPELTKRQVRTTDWLPGSVQRAQAYVIALMRVSVRLALAAMCAAGFEDYVFGFATPPANPDGSIIDVTGWAPFVAQQRYGVVQLAATFTRRTITLTNASATTYGPLQPGPALVVQFSSGNRYVLDQVVTIAPAVGGVPQTTTATFRSEFASNSAAGLVYNDPTDDTLQLVTANYPGVTASNPHTTYSPVAQAGSGIGTVTPSGSPSEGSHTVALRIDATGTAAAATVAWSTNVDNHGWIAQSGSSASNLGGYGINVTLSDNSGSPAFVQGAVYYFTTPGSDIIQVGADVETPQALGTRCRGLWPSLSFAKDGNGNWIPTSPTSSAYQALALSANSQVRLAYVAVDATVNNKVNIIVCGQGGAPLSPLVVANVQTFFNAYSMLTDLPTVATSTARAITLGGLSITAKTAQLATAQAALTQRLQAYLGGVDAATPISINPLIDYDYIIALARTTPGVTKVNGTLTINGGTTDLQLPLTVGAFESAQWTQTAATAFTWSTSS
jgi:hypothetical protein